MCNLNCDLIKKMFNLKTKVYAKSILVSFIRLLTLKGKLYIAFSDISTEESIEKYGKNIANT